MSQTISSLLPLAGTIALLGTAVFVSGATTRRIPEPLNVPLTTIDGDIHGWTAANDIELPPGALRALDASSYLARKYRKNDEELDLFIAFYEQQRAGQSMHSPKHCLPGAGWEIWKTSTATVTVAGERIPVNKYHIQNSGRRMLVFYWYQSKDRITASEYFGKLLLARDTLLTGRTSGSITRIMLPDTENAAHEGAAFASVVIPQLRRCFGN